MSFFVFDIYPSIFSGKMARLFCMITMISIVSAVKIVPIPRRHNISVAEFDRQFSSTSLPVIISGAIEWQALHWSREDIRRQCGGRRMIEPCDEQHSVKQSPQRHAERLWAGLEELSDEEIGNKTLNDIMDMQDSGRDLYVHDAPIDRLCPELLIDGVVKASKYFPEDFLEQLPMQYLRVDPGSRCYPHTEGPDGHSHGFPSFFIAKKGSGSRLHIDSKSTRFYMVVLTGRKHWRMVNPNESQRLARTRRGIGAFDAFQPTESSPITIHDGIANAGDIVFVPEDWAHQVENIGDTFAVAYNFIDRYNLKLHLEYLKLEDKPRSRIETRFYSALGFPFAKRPDLDSHQDETFGV